MTSVDVATSAGPLSLPGLGALGGFVIAAAIGYVLGGFEPRREQPVVAGSAMAVGSAVLLLALLAGVFVVNFDMVQPTLHAYGYEDWVAGLGAVVVDMAHALGAVIWVGVPHARRAGAVLTVMAAYISVLINLAGHAVVQENPRPGQPVLPEAAEFAMLPTTVALPLFVVVVAHVAATVIGPVVERWQRAGVSTLDDNSAVGTDDVSIAPATTADDTAEVVTRAAAEVVTTEASEVETSGEVSSRDDDVDNTGTPKLETRSGVSSRDDGADNLETRPMPRLIHSASRSGRASERLHSKSEGHPRGITPERAPRPARKPTGGAIKARMREVWERHVQDGSHEDLTGTRLAEEAGCGTRQLANKYLGQWRREVSSSSTSGDNPNAGVSTEGDNPNAGVSTSPSEVSTPTASEVVTDDNPSEVSPETDNHPVASIA